MKFLPLAIACLSFVGYTFAAEVAPWRLTNRYFPEDYSGGATVLSIVALRSGSIVIGSETGLHLFDGERWSPLPSGDVRQVRAIWEGPDGSLWFGGWGGMGILRHTITGGWRFTKEARLQVNESEMVWSLHSDRGRLAAVLDERVVWLPQDPAQTASEQYLPNDRRLLAFSFEGQLFVHQRGNRIVRADGEPTEWFGPAEDVPLSGAFELIEVGGERLLVSFYDGIYRLETNTLVRMPTEIDRYLETFGLSCVAVHEPTQQIIVGTLGRGVFLLGSDGRLRKQLTAPEELTSNTITSMKLVENGLWIGTNQGCTYLDLERAPYHFDLRKLLTGNLIAGVDSAPDGSLFLASANGIHVLRPLESDTYTFETIADGTFWNVANTPFGVLAAGQDGVYQVHEQSVQKIFDSRSEILRIQSFHDSSASVALIRMRDLVLMNDLNTFEEQETRNQIATSALKLDGEALLIGTANSAPLLQGTSFLEEVPMTFSWVFSLNGRSLLINELGLSEIRAGEYHPLLELDLLKDPYAHAFAIDAEHHSALTLLMDEGRRRTQFLIDEKGIRELVVPHESFDHRAITLDVETQFGWIAYESSLRRFDLEKVVAPSPHAPRIAMLEGTGADTRTRFWEPPMGTQLVHFPAGTAVLNASFASSTELADSTHYVAHLRDRRGRQIRSMQGAEVQFVGLRPGNYTLTVQSRIGSTMSSDWKSLRFRVAAPWYLQPWAIAGYAALAVLVVYVVLKIRTHQLTQSNIRLEAEVMERTKELERSNLELAKANNARAVFVASVSHEIRNPMSGILGAAEVIQQKITDPLVMPTVTSLVNTAGMLRGILDSILDLSSIDAGRIRFSKRPFSPAAMVREVIEIHRELAARQNMRLREVIQLNADSTLLGDDGRLRQVLSNLLTNAIKYADPGEVEIGVSGEATELGMECRFWVRDEGPGVDPAIQASLFDRFVRAPSAAEKSEGVGLGLALARDIVQALGGELWYDSSSGPGPCFVFALVFETTDTRAYDGAIESADLAGSVAVVVEDFDLNREILTENLEACQMIVHSYRCLADAREGLDFPVDIAFLDLNLPDGNGVELIPRLRELTRDGVPPKIVATTADIYDRPQEAFLAQGFDAVLPKPFTRSELFAWLKQNHLQQKPQKEKDTVGLNPDIKAAFNDELQQLAAELGAFNLETVPLETVRKPVHRLLGIARHAAPETVFQCMRGIQRAADANDRASVKQLSESLVRRIRESFVQNRPPDAK